MMPELKHHVLESGLDDWVYLAEVAQFVAGKLGTNDQVRIMVTTLSLIEELLDQGLVQVGDISKASGVFVAWSTSPEDNLSRIQREWSTLGRDVSLGDVCWLANTALGDEVALGKT